MHSIGRFLSIGLVLCSVSCKSGSDSDDAPKTVVFTSQGELAVVTGAVSFSAAEVFSTFGGTLLVRDEVTGSVVAVRVDGSVVPFASDIEIRIVTGGVNPALGPLDQISGGALGGQIIAADSETGLLLRIDANGIVRLHSNEAQITVATGEATASLSLPRSFAPDEILVQDTVSGDLLIIRNDGSVEPGGPLVTVEDLADAADVATADATVVQWVQAGSNDEHFARFDANGSIVRVDQTGDLLVIVDNTDLAALFPVGPNGSVTDLVADVLTNSLFFIVSVGGRGIAIGGVGTDGQNAGVLTSDDQFEDVAGPGYDISDIGMLPDGTLYAIDSGNQQVLIFEVDGTPLLLGRRFEIDDASGTSTPLLSVAAPLLNEAIIVFEETTGQLIRLE